MDILEITGLHYVVGNCHLLISTDGPISGSCDEARLHHHCRHKGALFAWAIHQKKPEETIHDYLLNKAREHRANATLSCLYCGGQTSGQSTICQGCLQNPLLPFAPSDAVTSRPPQAGALHPDAPPVPK